MGRSSRAQKIRGRQIYTINVIFVLLQEKPGGRGSPNSNLQFLQPNAIFFDPAYSKGSKKKKKETFLWNYLSHSIGLQHFSLKIYFFFWMMVIVSSSVYFSSVSFFLVNLVLKLNGWNKCTSNKKSQLKTMQINITARPETLVDKKST